VNQFVALIPKLIVSIGTLYFLVNPWMRHQNTINRVDAIFLFMILGTFLIYDETTEYLEPGIVLAVLTLGFAGAKIFFHRNHRDGFLLLNVYHREFESVQHFLTESAVAKGIRAEEICYSAKKPFLLVFHTAQKKEMRTVVKETEKFIREKTKVRFWPVYIATLVSLIILAVLWRF
jgi:hypothetical protein